MERARGTNPAYLESQAAFYREALKRATPAQRETIMDQLTLEAHDMAHGEGVPLG
jgi:hypothetical protein